MKSNRLAAVIAAILLASALLGGCNQATPQPVATLVGTSSAPAASPAETSSATGSPAELAPLDITWIGHGTFDPSINQDTPFEKIIEERFNVNIKVVEIYNLNSEVWNTYWASGNTADYISNPGVDYRLMVQQGLVRSITEDMIRTNMPNWIKKVEELSGDPDLVKAQMYYSDGNVYTVPFLHAPIMESGVMVIRQDWLDKLQLSVPKTLDDFHNVLVAFTKKDPDGNGTDDTYGINGNGRYHFNYVFGAFGIMPKAYNKAADGTVSYSSISAEYKDALKLLQSWFKEGLIDPETFTDDRTKQREKWAAGRFGILPDNAFWMSSIRGASSVRAMVLAKNPDAKVEPFAAITGPDGKSGSYLDFPNSVGQGAILFGKDTSDEKVVRLMQIKEAFASDYELYVRGYYGDEGVDWSRNADQKIVVSASVTPETYRTKGIAQFFSLQPLSFKEQENAIAVIDANTHKIAQEQPAIYTGVGFYAPKVNEANTNKGADVTSIVDEYYSNAISGKIDIDATWDAYVQQVHGAGLDEIIAEYEAMFK